jgi:hypothetical protein
VKDAAARCDAIANNDGISVSTAMLARFASDDRSAPRSPARRAQGDVDYENCADRPADRIRAAEALRRHGRVVSYITEALVDLGHDVTLFASGDSTTGQAGAGGRARCGSIRRSATASRRTCC